MKKTEEHKGGFKTTAYVAVFVFALCIAVRGDTSLKPANFIAMHMPPQAFQGVTDELAGLSFPMPFERIDLGEMIDGLEDAGMRAAAKLGGFYCAGMALNHVRSTITIERIEIRPPEEHQMVGHFTFHNLSMQADLEEPDEIGTPFCRGTAGVFADPEGLRAQSTSFVVRANIRKGEILLDEPELVGDVEVGELILPPTWQSRLTEKERKKPEPVEKKLRKWYPKLINLLVKEVILPKANIKEVFPFPIPIPMAPGYELALKDSPRLDNGYIGQVNPDGSLSFMFEGGLRPSPQRAALRQGVCPKPDRPPYRKRREESYLSFSEGKVGGDLPEFSNEEGASPFQFAITADLMDSVLGQLYNDRWLCYQMSAPLQGILHMVRPTTIPQTANFGVRAFFQAPPTINFSAGDQSGLNISLASRLGVQFFMNLEHRDIVVSGVDVDHLDLAASLDLTDEGLELGLLGDDPANEMNVKLSMPSNEKFVTTGLDFRMADLNQILAEKVIPGLLGSTFPVMDRTTKFDNGLAMTTDQIAFDDGFIVVGFQLDGLRRAIANRANDVAATFGYRDLPMNPEFTDR